MKKLWFISILGLLHFTNCVRIDGDIVQVNCQVLNAFDQPLEGFTVFLMSTDSFLPINLQAEQEKKTDKNGNTSFTFTYNRKLERYLKGMGHQGALLPIEQQHQVDNWVPIPDKPKTYKIHYDSLVPIRIRLKSNLPRMTKGAISVQLVIGGNRLADSEFSIISNSLDTIIQAQTFSHPEFIVWSGITTQDTFRAKSMIVQKGAKRDSILTLSY
jgi:hypothetical protein